MELQKIRAGVNGVQVSEDARLPRPPRWAWWKQLLEPAGKDTMVPDVGQ